MRQVWITKAGAPEVLQVREAPDPSPKKGEARIRVAAAGVNFADVVARMGMYPDFPGIPGVCGYEVAGKVDALGEGADPALLGKDVLALTRFNGYSDVVCVPAEQVFPRPAAMDALEGAAVPVVYLTAYSLVVAMGGLKSHETVLVHSAGGGVGIACIQLAKNIGAKVIGTASKGKHDYLLGIGVDHCIDYTREDFEKRVGEITKGRGVELVCDAVGGGSFKKGFRCLSPTGRLGMFGMSSATTGKTRNLASLLRFLVEMPWLQFNPVSLMNENKGVFGVNMGHMWGEIGRMRGWMENLMALYAKGIVKPKVDKTFKFAEAPAAHHYLQDRKNTGKVLLLP